MRPIVYDLYCGLGGWAEGFLAEDFSVIGFDIEPWPYPGTFRQQDVLKLDGATLADATCIVASPPCQFFSYTAMPWKKAKALAIRTRNDSALMEKELALFNACFRIQREASAATGRHIPMVVENVKGAQPWVGRAKWHFGSFFLWGDVPALMPAMFRGVKVPSEQGRRTDIGNGARFTSRDCGVEGIKQHGSGREWFAGEGKISRLTSSKSSARKLASAQIAKIPFPLAVHIARTFKESAVRG